MYDLLIKLFVKVVSPYLNNHFKLKLSRKEFCELEEDNYILHVMLKKLLLVWCTSGEGESFVIFKTMQEERKPSFVIYAFSEYIYIRFVDESIC